ncbi:Ovarian cancer-associated protein 2 [Coemansia sp. RSA 552]|nr:Ovarian cancer-associated protein 2 [Coemansia sp. RSA 552]
MSKPKILCLHGFGENAKLFQIRSRNFRAVVGDSAELVYPDGPIDIGSLHMTTGDLSHGNSASDFTNLAWWWMRRDRSFEARGIGKSLRMIGKVLAEQGPFDGVLGFSQGAALAIVIAALLQGGQASGGPLSLGDVDHPPFRFMVLAGAFELEVPEYSYLYADRIDIPSLHLAGEYDTVISPERSQQVRSFFVAPELFEFVGGHFIPQSPQCARVMRSFLAPFIPVEGEKSGAVAAAAATDPTAVPVPA